MTNVIIKVLILSVVISVFIKYVGPSLPIAATSTNALIGILTPALVVAIALVWRSGKFQQPS